MSSDIIGRTVAGCRITELIGRGGMGIVYKARHLELEQDRALKVMDPELARNEAFMKRFRIEAKALAKLKNPNIVTVHDLCETEIGVCLIMEYVSGSTLGEIIKSSGALRLERVYKIFRQILSALEHAHAAGVIHRDIKPGNMIVTQSDEVKVADFGLAKIQQQTTATVTQITGGTLYYVSPEQIEGLVPIDHRSDLYSLGMTLYEAITGAVPFDKTASEFKISERIVKGKISPPRTLNPQIPKELNDFVMKAIARNPESRFQSASEMRTELERIETEEKKSQTPAPWAKRYRVLITAAGAGVVLVVAGYLISLVVGPKPPPPTTLSGGNQPVMQSEKPPTSFADPLAVTRDSAVQRAEVAATSGKLATTGANPGPSVPPKEKVVAKVEKSPKKQPERLSVFIHDRKGNPIPNSTLRLVGLRGKEYRTRTDAEGKGFLIYDVETAGLNPLGELSLVLGNGQPLLLPKKKVLISASRMRLDVDINSFYPDWDKNIEMLMEKARKLIADEEWEDARTSLKQVLDRRPGQGSAEAYVLMGQSWFEHRKKYYPQALDALHRAFTLRKGLTGPTGTRLLEKMSYYLIVAGFEEYDDLDSDSPKRNELARALRDQCARYEQFSKGEMRKRLDAGELNQHVEKVAQILREVKK